MAPAVGGGPGRGLDPARIRVDRERLCLDDLDATAAETANVGGDLVRSPVAGEHPEERWGEPVKRLSLDDDDAVVVAEAAAQPVGRDDTPGPASEYDDRISRHLLSLVRTSRSGLPRASTRSAPRATSVSSSRRDSRL